MPKLKEIVILYLILCLVGTVLEWAYGTFWDLVGQAPWIYPYSIFRFSSLEVLPLWGIGGLISVAVYRAYTSRGWRPALSIIPLLAIAALWVLFYSLAIQ